MNPCHLSLVVNNSKKYKSKKNRIPSINNNKHIISLNIECFVDSETSQRALEKVENRMYKNSDFIREIVNGDFSYYISDVRDVRTNHGEYSIQARIEYVHKKEDSELTDIIYNVESLREKLENLLSGNMTYEIKKV